MKKTIFISVLALAATISCTKSDIVDTKFENEAIGFETYLGRDAQTKATVATAESLQQAKGKGIGIYGFYTGTDPYSATTPANILKNENLYYNNGWTYDNKAYWTNDKDNYTFFAYAPFGNANVVASQTVAQTAQDVTKAPQVTYQVPSALSDQVDLVYSNEQRGIQKKDVVKFTFGHALARLSVKANATTYDNMKFTITNISITGTFNTKGVFDLNAGDWIADQMVSGTATYDLTGTVNQELGSGFYNFSEAANNYLMMIPSNVSGATLTVSYKITYAGATSAVITKPVTITNNFAKGNAYAINLTLSRDEDNAIAFGVEKVEGWGTEQNVEI